MKFCNVVVATIAIALAVVPVVHSQSNGKNSDQKTGFKTVPILGKSLVVVEKALGKAKHIGTESDRYYKVNGFVRVVVIFSEKAPRNMSSIYFQFPINKVKSWEEALSLVGLDTSGAEKEETKLQNSVALKNIKGTPPGWSASWNTPDSDSGNDALILYSPDSL